MWVLSHKSSDEIAAGAEVPRARALTSQTTEMGSQPVFTTFCLDLGGENGPPAPTGTVSVEMEGPMYFVGEVGGAIYSATTCLGN